MNTVIHSDLGNLMVAYSKGRGYVPRSKHRIRDTRELIELAWMLRWEDGAPDDRKLGSLDGEDARNTQQVRLARLLNLLCAHDRDFGRLAELNRKLKSEASLITKEASSLQQAIAVGRDWFVEGCLNLGQKLEIVDTVRYIGRSRGFVEAAKSFVTGETVRGYILDDWEEAKMLIAEEGKNSVSHC